MWKAVGSTWTCFLAPEKHFGAWGLPLLLHLLTSKLFATQIKPLCAIQLNEQILLKYSLFICESMIENPDFSFHAWERQIL